MPTFAYSGRTRTGQPVAGERVADTIDAAITALRREQITVTYTMTIKHRGGRRGFYFEDAELCLKGRAALYASMARISLA